MLSEVAKEMQCYVIGGSIPERDSGKLYNTSTSFGPDGAMLAKHRKVIKTDSVQSSSNYLQKFFTKNLLTAR